jgi:replicative DNA helicase
LHDWPTIRAYDIARAARHCGAELIIVDYLQYVTAADKTMKRYEQVGQISRDLKAVARDLKVPVIACAQLNRQVDQSGKENRPRLSHLRESGDIENNADVVLLLFRPEGGITGKTGSKFAGQKWDADLDIAKNRNGRTDRLRLNWTPSFTRFECKDAPDIQQDGEYAGDFAGFSGEPDGEEF